MEYSKLVSVSGMVGLFELLSSKNDGAIVKHVEDQSTRFVTSRLHQFSHLESIEVYTDDGNVNLVEVFHAMKAAGKALPNGKDAKVLKAYFQDVFPSMDFERVYASDMKKMVKWFALLEAKGIEIKLSEAAADETVENENTEADEAPAEKEPAIKKARKNADPA